CSSEPSRAANGAGESKRGRNSQSIEPSSQTWALVCMSTIRPYCSMRGSRFIVWISVNPAGPGWYGGRRSGRERWAEGRSVVTGVRGSVAGRRQVVDVSCRTGRPLTAKHQPGRRPEVQSDDDGTGHRHVRGTEAAETR